MEEMWEQIQLKTGLHRIWIEYFNVGGPMGLNVSWQPKGGFKSPLPEKLLFHDPEESLVAPPQAAQDKQ